MEEIAFFTPKTKSGSAKWLDTWNADLYDGESHLNHLHNNDVLRFRKDTTTYMFGFETESPNGIIQAIFDAPENDFYLGILKLSGINSYATVYVDDDYYGFFSVDGNDIEIPITANLSKGQHAITVVQRFNLYLFTLNTNLWFHSLTCFQV